MVGEVVDVPEGEVSSTTMSDGQQACACSARLDMLL